MSKELWFKQEGKYKHKHFFYTRIQDKFMGQSIALRPTKSQNRQVYYSTSDLKRCKPNRQNR